MATKKTTKTPTTRVNRRKKIQRNTNNFKKSYVVIFGVAFALIAVFMLVRSFAAGTIKYIGVDVNAAEGSGMVASRQFPGVYWYMRDGGTSTAEKPREAVYAIKLDASGKPVPVRGSTLFPFNLINAPKNNNWEDIAIDEDNNIWIGDIGANVCTRTDQKIFKVKEPNPTTNETVSILASYTFRFPDPPSGCNTWNSEAMFWLDGKMYIFAKTSNSPVYRIDLPSGTSGTATLTRIGTLAGGVSNISVSSLSDDRSRLMVASHGVMNVYTTTNTSLRGDTLVRDLISRRPQYTASFNCGADCRTFVEGGTFKRNSYEVAFVDEPKKLYYGFPKDYGDSSVSVPTQPNPSIPTTASSPELTLSGLNNGAVLRGTLTFKANASDPDGIEAVTMRIDDKFVSRDDTDPYTFTINTSNYTKGTHIITIRAFDNLGNMSEKVRTVTFQ